MHSDGGQIHALPSLLLARTRHQQDGASTSQLRQFLPFRFRAKWATADIVGPYLSSI